MANSNAKSPLVKTCGNGENCIHPDGPTLPITEFYKRSGSKGLYHAYCKPCTSAKNKAYRTLPKEQSANSGELLLIHKLRSVGIYAAPGKSSEWRRLDVVAWGCVRIEVKTSVMNQAGKFHFGMGLKTGKEHDRSDVVVLICIADPITYHVFSSDHPVFYHTGGEAKLGIALSTRGNTSRNSEHSLDADLMAYHLDRWGLIEDARQRMVKSLLDTCENPDAEALAQLQTIKPVYEADSQQLKMFA